MVARKRRPTGRDEVMAAVQDAAVDLLAERGPREVTVREVAARAGVNHALVHRHFGTKDALIRTVVVEESRRIAVEAAALPRPDAEAMLGLLRAHGAYWRVLARLVLDEPGVLGDAPLPAAAATLALLAGGAQASEQTRTGAAVAAATALGWLVFGPHLVRALDADPAAVDAGVAATVRRSVSSRSGARAGPAS